MNRLHQVTYPFKFDLLYSKTGVTGVNIVVVFYSKACIVGTH